MNRLRNVWRKIRVLGMAAAIWLTVTAAVWAKPRVPMRRPSGSSEAGAGPWVLPYFLVILCIGLGLLTVLRASRRSAQARPK